MATKRRRGPVQEPGLDVLGPLQDIIRQVRKGKLAPEQLQAFAKHRNPFYAPREGSDSRDACAKITNLHKVIIARDLPWEKRVAAMGLGRTHYEFTPDLFPLGEPIERELGLLVMGRVFNLQEAVVGADMLDFDVAETEDGVAYVTAHPDLQLKGPIILGSQGRDSYGGRVVVLVFGCGAGVRSLDRRGYGRRWSVSFRVLVRRKSAAKAAV